MPMTYKSEQMHGTTVLCVRKDNKVVLTADGQVTMGDGVIKHSAKKTRRLYNDKIVAGFAGSTADALSLFGRFEGKLQEFHGNLARAAVELAKEWRTDRSLRHLDALLLVADAKATFLLSGNGDVIEPDDGICAIGSGGSYAARRRARAGQVHQAQRQGHRRRSHAHRQRNLHLHQRQFQRRRAMTEKSEKDMVIYLSGSESQTPEPEPLPSFDELTPREIVVELDKYIVGQNLAKKAVAIALRNRVRRQKLAPELAEDILPKNILMIGPTGVGKTEIARRLARLAGCPFVKVEASKYTEVGYVGRDVESMVRDLVETAIDMVREEKLDEVAERAEQSAEDRLLDLLLPPSPMPADSQPRHAKRSAASKSTRTREKLRAQLREGKLDQRMVEVEVRERQMPSFEIITNQGVEEMDINVKDMLSGMFGQQKKKRKMTVAEAFDYLIQEEENRLIDMDQVTRIAVDRVEQMGILFIDEIDKIAGRESGHGPDVSREGVQRDILPIVEGTTVNTRYGMVRTDHILFIAAGAFHTTKPSDLIPELQGRFPIRVELASLSEADFIRILTEPKNALIKQYIALLDTEPFKLTFHRRCHRHHREIRRQGERAHRKYRCAPPAHHPGESAGGNFLRSSRNEEEILQSGRRLRAKATGQHREGPGPQPLHTLENRKWKIEKGSRPSLGASFHSSAPIFHFLLSIFACRLSSRRLRRSRRAHRTQAARPNARRRSCRHAARRRRDPQLYPSERIGGPSSVEATAHHRNLSRFRCRARLVWCRKRQRRAERSRESHAARHHPIRDGGPIRRPRPHSLRRFAQARGFHATSGSAGALHRAHSHFAEERISRLERRRAAHRTRRGRHHGPAGRKSRTRAWCSTGRLRKKTWSGQRLPSRLIAFTARNLQSQARIRHAEPVKRKFPK